MVEMKKKVKKEPDTCVAFRESMRKLRKKRRGDHKNIRRDPKTYVTKEFTTKN